MKIGMYQAVSSVMLRENSIMLRGRGHVCFLFGEIWQMTHILIAMGGSRSS